MSKAARIMGGISYSLCSLCLLFGTLSGAGGAWAQGSTGASIYTCVDSQGHRQSADRLIAQCLDREQRELGPSGIVRRQIAPMLSEQEQAALQAERHKELEARSRTLELKRRGQVLVTRFPDQATHDAARAQATEIIDGVIAMAEQRIEDLKRQRKELDTEMAFYKKNPDKAPLALRSKIIAYEDSMNQQLRFIAAQNQERQRLHQQYDAELAQLRRLWGASLQSAADSAHSAPPR